MESVSKSLFVYQQTDQKPKSQKMILYGHHLCPYVQRVRLALALKKVDHTSCELDLSKRPQWYYDMNPVGKVPTVQFPDGRFVYESDILIEMVDEMCNTGSKLFPQDKIEKAVLKVECQKINKFVQAYYGLAFKGGEQNAAKVKQHLQNYDKMLGELKEGEFLGGKNMNAKDVYLYPHLIRAMWFKGSVFSEKYDQINGQAFKNIHKYVQSVENNSDVKDILTKKFPHQGLLDEFKQKGSAKLTLPVKFE